MVGRPRSRWGGTSTSTATSGLTNPLATAPRRRSTQRPDATTMFALRSPLRRTHNEGTSNGTQPVNRLVAAHSGCFSNSFSGIIIAPVSCVTIVSFREHRPRFAYQFTDTRATVTEPPYASFSPHSSGSRPDRRSIHRPGCWPGSGAGCTAPACRYTALPPV